jgi:hypothetical protein
MGLRGFLNLAYAPQATPRSPGRKYSSKRGATTPGRANVRGGEDVGDRGSGGGIDQLLDTPLTRLQLQELLSVATARTSSNMPSLLQEQPAACRDSAGAAAVVEEPSGGNVQSRLLAVRSSRIARCSTGGVVNCGRKDLANYCSPHSMHDLTWQTNNVRSCLELEAGLP